MPEQSPGKTIQPDNGLQEALANAVTPPSADAPWEQPEPGVGEPTVLRWVSPRRDRPRRRAAIGMEFSCSRLVLVELQKTRSARTLRGVLDARFDQPADPETLVRLLREFRAEADVPVRLSLTSPRAVVRQFRLPPVPRKRRVAVALWEARKLIPFPLQENKAVYGLRFESLSAKGWRVTLTAVPGDDANPVLSAIENAGWTLDSVSISGTQQLAESDTSGASNDEAQSVASVLWSPARTSFVVFHRRRLCFHYDLGPLPLPLQSQVDNDAARAFGSWLSLLEKGISEAIEFCLGANPRIGLDRIELWGLPAAVAPLVTDWKDRLNAPVVVRDVFQSYTEALPEQIGSWLDRNRVLFTTAVLAAEGTPSVDMMPLTLVRKRRHRSYGRVLRWGFLLSLTMVLAWTGLAVTRRALVSRRMELTRVELQTLQTSPANIRRQQLIAELQRIQTLTKTAGAQPIQWMPQVQTTLRTLPVNARLLSLEVTGDGAPSVTPLVRMEGKLLPSTRPHTLTFSDWINRMKAEIPGRDVNIVSNRTTEWKGKRTSLFVLEIRPFLNNGRKVR